MSSTGSILSSLSPIPGNGFLFGPLSFRVFSFTTYTKRNLAGVRSFLHDYSSVRVSESLVVAHS